MCILRNPAINSQTRWVEFYKPHFLQFEYFCNMLQLSLMDIQTPTTSWNLVS